MEDDLALRTGGALPGWQIIAAVIVLASITFVAVRTRRDRPYLLVGWLWYLVTLLPVIGLVQVGQQAMADRYSYVPLIGIFVVVVFGLADLLPREPEGRTGRAILAGFACVAIVLLVAVTRFQLAHWRSSETLFAHTLQVTRDNAIAHNGLALALTGQGRADEALPHYRSAIAIRPSYAEAWNNLGGALAELRRTDDAIASYERALDIDPRYVEALNNLGVALARAGRLGVAIERFHEALEIRPSYGKSHANLAAALHQIGDHEAAWREIEASRRHGFEPPAPLVRSLTEKLGASQD